MLSRIALAKSRNLKSCQDLAGRLFCFDHSATSFKMDMSKFTSRWPKPAPGDDTTEFDLMVKGGMYQASDPYVQKIAQQESAKVKAINAEQDDKKRDALLRDFMGLSQDVEFYWMMPIFAEYVSSKSYVLIFTIHYLTYRTGLQLDDRKRKRSRTWSNCSQCVTRQATAR
jgi:hypothetical protein